MTGQFAGGSVLENAPPLTGQSAAEQAFQKQAESLRAGMLLQEAEALLGGPGRPAGMSATNTGVIRVYHWMSPGNKRRLVVSFVGSKLERAEFYESRP